MLSVPFYTQDYTLACCYTFHFFSSTIAPQLWHVEVLQAKVTRKMPQIVGTEGFGEDIGSLTICQKISKFHLTKNDSLSEKMVVHLNVLFPGVEDGVLGKLDVAEVVVVNRRRIRHLHLQILE